MIECIVRPASESDETAVLALAQTEMDDHARMDERFRLRSEAPSLYAVYLRERIQDLDSAVFVAEVDGGIRGIVIASVRVQKSVFEARRFGYVSDLVVSSEVRRHGVARQLWEKAVAWIRSLGVDVVRLHVAPSRGDARAFWESQGARDYLTEMWIDLREEPAAPTSPTPTPPAPTSLTPTPPNPPPPAAGPEGSEGSEA